MDILKQHMGHYIDADKLLAEIERKISICEKQRSDAIEVECYNLADHASARIGELHVIQETIASRQQEQPDVDLAEEITKFFSENPIPHEHITDWPLLKNTALHFFNHGLNARKDKLPEIELDKFTEKIKTFQGRYKHPEIVSIKGAMAFMARMFYQYSNVARQWYDSLPKATMN